MFGNYQQIFFHLILNYSSEQVLKKIIKGFSSISGRCGLCGDDWQQSKPRKHEHGGRFGQGVIVKTYKKGQIIDVTSKLTVNHNRGQFIFKLCNMDVEAESDSCFEKNPIFTADGQPFYQVPDLQAREFHHQMRLPENITCKHCVLQWTYVAANNWGQCANNRTRATGCGPQEHFRTCSDISIIN